MHRCHLLITKYRQPCSLVEFAGKSGTFYRSTDRRFDRTDRLLHRHRSCASTIRTSEASTTEVNALKNVVGNHSSKLTFADGRTIVPAERRTMSIPVKVDHATSTKRRSKPELVLFKTSSKAVLTTDRPNVGLVSLVSSISGPGKVGYSEPNRSTVEP